MTSVEVCPICDIAGCRHIRERAAEVAAAPAMGGNDEWFYQPGFVQAFVRELPFERKGIPAIRYVNAAALTAATKRAERAEAERDELKRENRWLRGNCDADTEGVHTVITEGRYKFCAKCGETITPDKRRMAEAFAGRDQWKARADRLRAALDNAVARHKAEISAFEQQIEANNDYMSREGLNDHAANDACRTGIYYHMWALREIDPIRAAIAADTKEADHE